MKTLILILTTALLSPSAWSLGQVSADVTAKARIHMHHIGISRGGLKCKGGSNGTYTNVENEFKTKTTQFSTTSSLSENLNVQSGYFKMASGYGLSDLLLFQVKVSGRVSNKNETTTVSAKINESIEIPTARHDWGGGCSNNHYIENLKSASYAGKITLSYTVPKGVWAMKVSESDYNRVFKVNSASKESGIQGALFETRLLGERVIWVIPGSQLKKTFALNATANKENKVNSYSISFTPLGSELTAAQMQGDWIDSFLKGILLASNKKAMDAISKTHLIDLLTKGFSILRSKNHLAQAMETLTTDQLFEVAHNLHNVAMGNIYAPDLESKYSLRTLAALASYEVASLLVEDFAPFCELTEHDLPYLKETTQVSGIQWGAFILSRMIRRLKTKDGDNPNSTNLFSNYEEFFNLISKLEEKETSYRSIFDKKTMTNLELPENMAEKLRSSFEIVRASSHPQSKPVARSYQDLMNFYSVYSTIGTNDQLTSEILEKMQRLAKMEHQFVKLLIKNIRKFSKDNDDKVNFTDIKTRLSEIKILLDDVIQLMEGNMRLISISEGTGPTSIKENLTRLRVHSINIIKNQYTGFESIPEFDFETIRSNYVDPVRAQKNVDTVMLCLTTGGVK